MASKVGALPEWYDSTAAPAGALDCAKGESRSGEGLGRVTASFERERAGTSGLFWLIYLQLLDLLTTAAFLAHGVEEGNPLIRLGATYTGSYLPALVAAKLGGVLLAVACWRLGKTRLLRGACIGYAALIVWNLLALIAAPGKS